MNIFKYVCTFFVRLPEGKTPLFGISGWLGWLCLLAPLVVVSFFSSHFMIVQWRTRSSRKRSFHKKCVLCAVSSTSSFSLGVCHPPACTSLFIPSSRSLISNLLLARLISSREAVGCWRPRSFPFCAAVAFFRAFFNLKFSNYRHFIFSVHFSLLSF